MHSPNKSSGPVIRAGSSQLEDIKINSKTKLSALWTSVTLCYLYGDYFELYVPQKTQGLVDGANLLNSPAKLLAASVLLAVPALMVFLSLVLKPVWSKRLNMALGIFYTAVMVLIAVSSLTPWRSFYVFLALLESGLTALIVYYAWHWPHNQKN